MATPSPLQVREVPGKGRGVFSTRLIRGGEVVISELPLLLYPQQSAAADTCAHCLRMLGQASAAGGSSSSSSTVPCAGCSGAAFCSPACAAAAATDPASHCRLVCSLGTACNTAGLGDEGQSALQLLFRVCSLRAATAAGDAAAGARLTSLATLAPAPLSSCSLLGLRELQGRLGHALSVVGAAASTGLSLADAEAILLRDAANGYGIMAPSGPQGERRVRGTGIYSTGSLINHECLPSVARFDRFDAPLPAGAAASPLANAAVEFRALHDIPAGEEVMQSYFPLPYSYRQRQRRCQEQYGFLCSCPRCQEEATWAAGEQEGSGSEWETDEGEGAADQDGDCGMAEAPAAQPAAAAVDAAGAAAQQAAGGIQQQMEEEGGSSGGVDAAYISIFLLKYVCPLPGCHGTLAPTAPGTQLYECSMCGAQRSEADFLAELEAAA